MLLQGKLIQEVRYITGQDKGGLLLPTNTFVSTETLVADLLFSKHPNRTSPALEAFRPYVSSPAIIDLDITSYIDRVQDSHEEQEFWMTRLDWVGIRLNQFEMFEEH